MKRPKVLEKLGGIADIPYKGMYYTNTLIVTLSLSIKTVM